MSFFHGGVDYPRDKKFTTPFLNFSANGKVHSGRRQRQRQQVDYPSFANDPSLRKKSQEAKELLLMKIKNSSGKEEIFRTTRTKYSPSPQKDSNTPSTRAVLLFFNVLLMKPRISLALLLI
jgi:hypothetical protein